MSARAARRLSHVGTVARLLWDLVWPPTFSSLTWVGMLPAVYLFFVEKGLDAGWLMGGSMAIAGVMGLSGDRIGQREYRVLPVNDRDLWVTRWIYTTCLGPALLLMVKCVLIAGAAYTGRTLLTLDTLLLSTLYDTLYAGAFLPIPIWLDTEARAMAERSGRSAFQLSLTLMFLAMPFAIAAPLLLARSLPKHVAEFSIVGGALLGIGVIAAIAAFAWTPRNAGASTTLRLTSPAIPAQPGATVDGRRLEGIPVMLWSHTRITFAAGLLVMLIAAAITPFMPAKPEPARMVTDMFILFALMGVAMASVWTPWVKRLKVLPLSAKQINALFMLTPLFTWLALWAAMLLVHVVLDWPLTVEVGPVAILMYTGLTALTHAMVIPLNGSVRGQTMAAMVGMGVAAGTAITLFDHPDIPPRLLMLAVGALSFGAAATINHFTLTRSTSSARVYRWPWLSIRP